MKLAVFSDIHGNIHALEAIINDIKNNNVDQIIFLGDALSIGPKPNECVELLRKHNVIYLLGNHERYLTLGIEYFNLRESAQAHQKWTQSLISDDNKEYLKKQSLRYDLELNGKKFIFMHFPLDNITDDFYHAQLFTEDNVESYFSDDADYYIFGHHHVGQDLVHNNKRYLNVASSGCTDSGETHYYLIESHPEIKIDKINVNYDFSKLKEDVLTSSNPINDFLAPVFFGINL